MRRSTPNLRHRFGIALALVAACAAFGATNASAALFMVNTTDDDVVGLCEMATPCSLREAIVAANSNGTVDEDTIGFALAGGATIAPATPLPSVSANVNIDAPYGSDDARVILSGASQGSGDGLHLLGDDVFLRGLVINGFTNVGVLVNGFDASIENVRVGTNAFATAAVPNGSHGIAVIATGNGVGTQNMLELDYSVVSGNGGSGVWFNPNSFAMRPASLRTGNFIGTNADASAAIPNLGSGVLVTATSGSVPSLSIGTLDPEESGNVIAANGADGVTIVDNQPGGVASGVRLFRNRIHSNGGLGLDLADDGVTANDAGDTDSGPNELQNFPVLSSASATARDVSVNGTLSTFAGAQNYRIEVFASPPGICDPSGHGEGVRFLYADNVTTDGAGNATIDFDFEAAIQAGSLITATATNPAGSTSEFSACLAATTLPTTFTVNATDGSLDDACEVDEHCSFRDAVAASNAWPALDTIAFDLGGSPTPAAPHVITVPVPVTVSDPAIIDGSTQPGFAGTPVVALDGEQDNSTGLTITAGDTTVRVSRSSASPAGRSSSSAAPRTTSPRTTSTFIRTAPGSRASPTLRSGLAPKPSRRRTTSCSPTSSRSSSSSRARTPSTTWWQGTRSASCRTARPRSTPAPTPPASSSRTLRTTTSGCQSRAARTSSPASASAQASRSAPAPPTATSSAATSSARTPPAPTRSRTASAS